jgi:hypothetical protein
MVNNNTILVMSLSNSSKLSRSRDKACILNIELGATHVTFYNGGTLLIL